MVYQAKSCGFSIEAYIIKNDSFYKRVIRRLVDPRGVLNIETVKKAFF